ncbi:MAG: sulfotransferase family protein, partial [Actinomycetota bacterium]
DDADVWIDHTPNNIRRAATLAQAFPDASFVHLVRDGRAVAASLMKVEWGPNSVHRAAHYWLEGTSFGLAAESWLKDRCVRVRYEDLIARTDGTLRWLTSELGIEHHADMAHGGGLEVPVYTKEQHALVGRPPEQSRASAWERELSDREIEIFEAVVGDQLSMLGYEPRVGGAAVPPTTMERRRSELMDLYRRRVTNKIRKRSRIRTARRAGP